MKKTTILTYLLFISVFTFLSFTDNPINYMVKVEGGTFKMGSKTSDKFADNDEQNEHSVTVKDFELCKFEVTVGNGKNM